MLFGLNPPANLEVMVSSYSSLTFSSRSLSRRSEIMPTCRSVNNGCSLLEGETLPEEDPEEVNRYVITRLNLIRVLIHHYLYGLNCV